jgi:hypothetical protein
MEREQNILLTKIEQAGTRVEVYTYAVSDPTCEDNVTMSLLVSNASATRGTGSFADMPTYLSLQPHARDTLSGDIEDVSHKAGSTDLSHHQQGTCKGFHQTN